MDDTQTKRIANLSLTGTVADFSCLIRIYQSHRLAKPVPFLLDLTPTSEVLMGRGDGDKLTRLNSALAHFLVDDPCMSGQHARIVREEHGSTVRFALEDQNSTNGCRVNGEKVSYRRLVHGDIVETGQSFWKFFQQPTDNQEWVMERAYRGGAITPNSSVSPLMIEELGKLERIATSNISVLLQGESGTGKEVMSGELHRMSGREGPFVALNCAAIPEGLVESELFGHRKGAFTGAVSDKQGVVEAAHKGTLLLDEIGDMPLPAQAKLLRVLQEGTFVRVGDTSVRRVDVRFVAATHRDLMGMVHDQTFRGDLFGRLNGFPVILPPLRDRPEDLGLLLTQFLRRAAGPGRPTPRMDVKVLRAFALYHWPFNIRELKQAVETSVALAGSRDQVRTADIPRPLRDVLDRLSGHDDKRTGTRTEPVDVEIPGARGTTDMERPGGAPPSSGAFRAPKRRMSVEDRREGLEFALAKHQGNVSAVARELDTTRMQVHRWMKKLGIDPNDYRQP